MSINYSSKKLDIIKSKIKNLIFQKSLLINSVPQVTSTLVGMRTTDYVEDILISIKNEYLTEAAAFWHNNRDINN